MLILDFPGSSDGKDSACNAGDLGLIPGVGRYPGGGHSNPLRYSYLENGQGSLAGYSPWGCKESHMTEQLSTAQCSSQTKSGFADTVEVMVSNPRERQALLFLFSFIFCCEPQGPCPEDDHALFVWS